MADEPENMTLKLLREIRAEQERLATMLGKVTDAVTQIEFLTRHSAILEHHSGVLESINEVQANNGARLNVIDGRLAIIEKRIGLVQA